MTSKVCTKCKIHKEAACFSLSKTSTWCKSCVNQYAKAYREKNKNIIQVKQQTWYNQAGQEWKKAYDNNRLSYVRERDKQRYNTDAEFRLKKILRTRLYKTIKGNKTSKHLLSALGIPLLDFRKWIEFQFDDSMCWDNYGTYWEIDHVLPCDSFDLTKEEEVSICFCWKNMRPLLKIDNSKKSNKIDHDVISHHSHVVENYLKLTSTNQH